MDKYLGTIGDRAVDTNEDQDYPADDGDRFEAERPIVLQSLDQIANEVGVAMRDVSLNFPIGMAVPASGCLLTVMTPSDPKDDEWSAATGIVCQIVAKRLNGMKLRARELPCAIVNAPMTAAEIIPNELTFEFRS
jgi:hypothetical protein